MTATMISATELHRLDKLLGAPDFVKNAQATDLHANGLPANLFADPTRKHYPGHTRAALWTSAAEFFHKKAQYRADEAALIEERLKHFAAVHGMAGELNKIEKTAAAGQQSDELQDDDYALVIRRPNQQPLRRYPLRNAGEVKKAAIYLQTRRDQIPFTIRRDMADRILNKANQLGTKLDDYEDYIQKQAGHGACAASDVVIAIHNRVGLTRKSGPPNELQEGMLKLAGIIERNPSCLRVPGTRVKLAQTLDEFDRATRLTALYREGLSRPEDVAFNLTGVKMASFLGEHAETITGNVYRLDDLEKLRLQDVRDSLGNDVAGALTSNGITISGDKAAAVVPTLPRPEANLLDRLLTESGVFPVMKEASADVLKLERQFLMDAARHYRPGSA